MSEQSSGGTDLEEHKSKIKEELRASEDRLGWWPEGGPFLESLDYVTEDDYDAIDTLDAWDELFEEGEIEKFEGREGTQIRIVETEQPEADP